VIIGAGGVEKVIDVKLNAEEQAMFDHSVASVKELIGVTKGML
jgi:malate dehydrogenase